MNGDKSFKMLTAISRAILLFLCICVVAVAFDSLSFIAPWLPLVVAGVVYVATVTVMFYKE